MVIAAHPFAAVENALDPMLDRADDPVTMSAAMALCWRLVADADTLAFSLADLGDIELPPSMRPAADIALIESTAPLYLASELEAARLLAAVETLASISISGGLRADIGPAGGLLYRFWQRRNDRFAAPERAAFFARLFGAPTDAPLAIGEATNDAFEPMMIALAEALYQIEPALPTPTAALVVRLRMAATRLVANLAPRSGGIASFAGRDLLRSIQEAIDILKVEPLQRALGANGVWSAVGTINRLYLHESVDVESHVRRAKSGTVILSWLASTLDRLDDGSAPLVSPGDQVLGAAATWLEASLALEETKATAAIR
jgi:hypothetical protein